jgi:hypothetical protein
MMDKFARYIEIFLGLFFFASAGMKAMNVDGFGVAISAYGVIKEPSLVRFVAYTALGVETALGAAFIAGLRWKFLSFVGSIALTAVFSGLIAYAWLVNGLEDCGCFGDYVKMTPPQSLAKNAVLIFVTALSGFGLRNSIDPNFTPGMRARGIAMLGAMAVVLIGAVGNMNAPASTALVVGEGSADKDMAFQIASGKTTFDLGSGEHLVVFLNTECEHCMASVSGLNELNADDTLPKMIALMLGDDEKLDDFIIETEPEFSLELFDQLTWTQFIKTAPPTMYFIKDGMIQHDWEWAEEPPTPDEVAESTNSEED